jgi:hypothetical protein
MDDRPDDLCDDVVSMKQGLRPMSWTLVRTRRKDQAQRSVPMLTQNDQRQRSAHQSMIRKSLPSGFDPMGGRRFSEKIMLKQNAREG